MAKQEDIFLLSCFNAAKEDLIARNVPIEGNEKKLFDLAEKLYKEAEKRKFLDIAR